MIFLYSKLDIQNKGEGLGSLQDFVEEPIVTWNASGFLEVEFKYFLYGDLAEYMIPDAKLKTRIHSNDEVYHLFTIYEVEPDYIENTIQVRAEMTLLHELKDRVVPADTMRGTANEMIMFVKNKMDRDYPFVITGNTDKTVFIEHDNISAYELIFGEDGILKRTGAEIEFTDRGIRVSDRIGTIHRDELRESDFVTNLTVNELQGEDFVTRIIPFTTAMFDRPVRDGDRYTRETIETPTYGTPVVSPNITNKLYKVRTKFVEYRNESTEVPKYYNYQTDRGTETLEMSEYVYEDVTGLNHDASTFFEDNPGIDEPTTTITIETLGLAKGYYTYLRYLNRYDIVTIYVEPKPYLTNTSETYVVQVNETVYEPLSDNLVSIGFTNDSMSLRDAYRNVNEGRISGQKLQAELQRERLRDLEDRLVNYVYNYDGFRLEFGNVLPPPDEYREGDMYYLETGEGIDLYKLVNGAWEFVVGQSTREIIEGKFEELEPLLQDLSDEIEASDQKADEALEAAGANASLLTTHQSTLNTINTVTLPDIASSAQDALTNAKDAMDEAKKADGKIANFVTTNGLVSGTTVDSKIDEATGEISRTIRTVESKIPTEIGTRNYVINSNFASDFSNWHVNNSSYVSLNNKVVKASGFYGAGIFSAINNTSENDTYTISVYVKGTGSIRIGFESNVRIIPIPSQDNFTRINFTTVRGASNVFILYTNTVDTSLEFRNIQIEKGSILTDWKLAPEDNYTQEEFKIFESTYSEDVKGIRSSLSALSNSKLDGSTYTTFYKNEYEKTAEKATDAYTKIGKVVDENGNTTDSFAKAVYDQNATRRTESFNEVTKGLVKEATYTAGINGISGSISTISGRLDNLTVGGRNYALKSNVYYYTTNYQVSEYDLSMIPKGTKIKISVWGGLGTSARTFGAYINNGSGLTSGNSQIIELTKLDGVFGQGVSVPLAKWTGEATLNVDANKVLIFGLDSNYSAPKRVEYIKVETGGTFTDWTIAPEDMLGKADFQVFQSSYEANDKLIKARLLAIDSSEEGSVVTRLNTTEKTARGNTTTISDIKKSPEEQITGYQTIKERSDLYERVIGKDEEGIKSNTARIVMTSDLWGTEVSKVIDNELEQEYKTVTSKVNVVDGGRDSRYGESYPGGRFFYFNSRDGYVQRVLASNRTYTLEFSMQSGDNKGTTVMLQVKHYNTTSWETLHIVSTTAGTQVNTFTFDNTTFVNSVSDYRLAIHNADGTAVSYIWGFRIYEEVDVEVPITSSDTGAIGSKITQLYDMINLSVLGKEGALSRIAIGEEGIQIDGKLLHITAKTYIDDAIIKSAMIDTLDAGKITTGELNASLIRVVNLDANSITGNEASFISALFSGTKSTLQITGSGVRVLDNLGRSSTYLDSTGIEISRAGVNLGKMQYVTNVSKTGDLKNMNGIVMRPNRGSYFAVSYLPTAGTTESVRRFAVSGRTGNVYIQGLIKPSEQHSYGINVTWGTIIGGSTNVEIWNHNKTGGIHIANGDLHYISNGKWRSLNGAIK